MLNIPDLMGRLGDGIRGQVLLGGVLSGIGAYLAVRFLDRYSVDNSLRPFAVYCLVAGPSRNEAATRSLLSERMWRDDDAMMSRPPAPRQPDDDAGAPLSSDEIREELRILEANISGAEKTAAEFRRLIGERSAGADREELGQLITQSQEQDAILRVLAARRERLQKLLAEAGTTE